MVSAKSNNLDSDSDISDDSVTKNQLVYIEHELSVDMNYFLKLENTSNSCYANATIQALLSFNKGILGKVRLKLFFTQCAKGLLNIKLFI